MPELGIIVPVWLQEQRLYNILRKNVQTYKPIVDATLYVVANRLNPFEPKNLLYDLQLDFTGGNVKLINEKERSVGGAWNRGIREAIADGCKYLYIAALDVSLHSLCLSNLLKALIYHTEYDMISSVDFQQGIGCNGFGSGCDFSSVIFRKEMVEKYGWFDKEYKPAYFEDNDYVTRIILAGGQVTSIYDAIHYHLGSATIKHDGESAHHVKHWFPINQRRFQEKWGHPVSDDPEFIKSNFYQTPYNSGKPLYWWREQEKPYYQVDGGIHD
jgi:GT2 family glycosyltransferase